MKKNIGVNRTICNSRVHTNNQCTQIMREINWLHHHSANAAYVDRDREIIISMTNTRLNIYFLTKSTNRRKGLRRKISNEMSPDERFATKRPGPEIRIFYSFSIILFNFINGNEFSKRWNSQNIFKLSDIHSFINRKLWLLIFKTTVFFKQWLNEKKSFKTFTTNRWSHDKIACESVCFSLRGWTIPAFTDLLNKIN